MPEISRFYGIVIRMFFKPKEHEPSHIHVSYNQYKGVYDIQTMKMKEGDLPKKAQELVEEWLSVGDNQRLLQQMWDSQEINNLPPL